MLTEFEGRYYLFHERDSINRLARVAFFHKEFLKLCAAARHDHRSRRS